MQSLSFSLIRHNQIRNLIVKLIVATIIQIMVSNFMIAQTPRQLFKSSVLAHDSGNFIESEKYLLKILQLKETIKKRNIIAVYNQLGMVNRRLGKYQKAIDYYTKGEKLVLNDLDKLSYKLPSLYNNKANIFKLIGDYDKALVYYKESFKNLNSKELNIKERLVYEANTYNNIGLVYFEKKDYKTALNFLKKRILIDEKYDLREKDFGYYNYANCLRDLCKYKLAEDYYKKCIDIRLKRYGSKYYGLSKVYMSYGKLKLKTKKQKEAIELYRKALKVNKISYGDKHPYIADVHQFIGDYYLEERNNQEALKYYQKSLIANSKDFNGSNIKNNPKIDNVFSEVQLLKSLKKKSEVLALMANGGLGKDKKQALEISVSTLELALEAIKNMRHGYLSRESKLYITQNEKEFYIMGIENALQLYELTNDNSYLEKSYLFSIASKAAVLMDEINQNEAFEGLLPDSLKERKNELLQNIASHKKLIFDEHKKLKPNQTKISNWQSELFRLNKNYEFLLTEISKTYPEYSKLLGQKKLLTINEIQKKLATDETLIEYSYAINQNEGYLYTFVVNNHEIKYYKTSIDSTFEKNIDFCRQKMNFAGNSFSKLKEYNKHNQKLYSLYKLLIKPLNISERKNVIIVPDGKIAYLSFDALISEFREETEINYANLPYLLFDYKFSYAYSTNLLFRQNNRIKWSNQVYAFAPGYSSANQSQSRDLFGELKNAKREIESILKHFEGASFTGDSATKSNFKSTLKYGGIYHLAMHANSVKENPDYSYLAFSQPPEKKKGSLMYNYEIGNIPMNASMLVLSACNTGDGEIFKGEGVMSISRGFILAGIQSVVHGLWKINDESSSIIMGDFYRYLSEGKSKSEALQLAKINFIENASPELANPKYWSGIVLMGNQHPIVKNQSRLIYFFTIVAILGITLLLYFRNRKKSIRKTPPIN